MRTIKAIHQAENAPIADLITYRALPTQSIENIDPFILLNHHGYQVYPHNNNGLPFGPHPHRGFETVTFILKGELSHQDSSGAESVIRAGGVQWMTAGKGLIHAEISSAEFMKDGGELEILQLWVNLPAKFKMVDPAYRGLQKNDIPAKELDNGRVTINAISGHWEETQGAFQPLVDIRLATVIFQSQGKYQTNIAEDRNIFFYVVKGNLTVNGQPIKMRELVEFNNTGNELSIEATEESTILIVHALPFNEPIVAQGPFVMNTENEIERAYQDYREGKFGVWKN